LEVLGGNQAETDSHFDTPNFRFHAPDGFETDYPGLSAYFAAIRQASTIARFDEASSSPTATTLPANLDRGNVCS
jgi:hypothetical protein